MFSKFWKKIASSDYEALLESIQITDKNLEKYSFSELREKAFSINEKARKLDLDNQNIDFLIEELLIEVYSVSIQFIRREKGISLFPTQIIGSIVLNEGNVCQMNTGEGKTMTAILPACLNAVLGLTVNVVTTNDYLAERDWNIAKPLFDFFNLESAVNLKDLSLEEKKSLYSKAKVIYSTASELCFDYLKYNLLPKRIQDKCDLKFDFTIIDEIDSILIDNSQNPLVISSSAYKDPNLEWEKEIGKFEEAIKIADSLLLDKDYDVDETERSISLKKTGLDKINHKFNIKNIFDFSNSKSNFLIFNAIKVIHFFRKGVEYVVDKENKKILLIDSSTGRISHNRVYEYGIQQLIESKEGVKLTRPSITNSKITFPNFFRMFSKISGMSGTAEFESKEFMSLYGMEVVKIPPYKKLIRKDRNDVLFLSNRKRYNAVISLVKKNLKIQRRPLLVGVQDLETSEYLSKIFKALKIEHYKINAVNHRKEAEIVSKVGKSGAVTIATNMAGRGTDIVLSKESIESGGLIILVLGRSEISRRLDDQFIGRGGRQGNPGESIFYLSIEDGIFKNGFKKKDFSMLLNYLNKKDFLESYSGKILNFLVSNYQNSVRFNRYISRKNTLHYDLSLNKSRKDFYNYRNTILSLEGEELIEFLVGNKDLDISDFEPVNLYSNVKKRIIFEADFFWSSYLKFSEKMLKVAFLDNYLQRSPQEQFFLKMNDIFKKRFYFFKLSIKSFVLLEIKEFLLKLKDQISEGNYKN